MKFTNPALNNFQIPENKLRVLLVPDFFSWILGTWAKQIVQIGTKHEYYFFSQQMLPYYPNEWKSLLEVVDVVHFLNQWEVKNIAIPSNLARITSVHHVVDESEWQEQLLPLMEAHAIMVVAKEWEEFLLQKGIPSEDIYLFHNGVDITRFYPFKNKQAARKALGINSSYCILGYAAKFTSNSGGRKGIEVFLDSLKLCVQAGYKFGVLITGPGWNEVIQKIENLGVEVYYHPFLPDRLMPTVYNAVDIYVSTAKIEGGPVPIIESMACATPVVTTPVGIVKDFLDDEGNALIVPKDNAQATAKAINRLIFSPNLRHQLGSKGLQTIKNYLTWDSTLTGIEHLYENVWQVKARNKKRNYLDSVLNPAKQRNWAINVDSFLWYQQFYRQGYQIKGLLGMLRNSINAGTKESPRLMYRTLSTLMKPKSKY